MIAGALAGTTVALVLGEARVPAELAKTPGAFDLIIVTCSLISGFLAGALYGGLAGFLKAYFGVNEILSTIMLNQIAVQMMNFLLNGILLDPATAGFNNIPKNSAIGHGGAIAALAASDWRSLYFHSYAPALGFDHRDCFGRHLLYLPLAALRWAIAFARSAKISAPSSFAGINVKRQMMFSMFLAGGLRRLGRCGAGIGLAVSPANRWLSRRASLARPASMALWRRSSAG